MGPQREATYCLDSMLLALSEGLYIYVYIYGTQELLGVSHLTVPQRITNLALSSISNAYASKTNTK
jgi:hypothetical protein